LGGFFFFLEEEEEEGGVKKVGKLREEGFFSYRWVGA